MEINSGAIDWPGAGVCSMVLAKEIHEGNKSLFFNLTSLTAYDELYELNLTQNTFDDALMVNYAVSIILVLVFMGKIGRAHV